MKFDFDWPLVSDETIFEKVDEDERMNDGRPTDTCLYYKL